MIEFASLFLGLYLGVVPVEVLVGEEVAAVELRLDGEMVGRLQGPPWVLPCDLGPELAPRELVAVAFDDRGREVGRARQGINVSRPAAEARIVLRRHGSREVLVGHVAWNSAAGDDPVAVRATLDGESIEADEPGRIALPPLAGEPDTAHFLRVELEFPRSGVATAEVVFGGRFGERVATAATAVPVWLAKAPKREPRERVRGALAASGVTLEVAGLEEGLADVVLVPDLASGEIFAGFLEARRRRLKGRDPMWRSGAPDGGRFLGSFPRDLRLRVLWPLAETRLGEDRRRLLRPSPDMSPWDAGLLAHLATFRPVPGRSEQRIADAVAMAGLVAAERSRRRAVILALGDTPEDRSRLTPSRALGFLEHLGVPLFLWWTGPGEPPDGLPWGEAEEVASVARLERALRKIGKALERQRIVWVEGSYLPQAIRVQEDAGLLRVGARPFLEGLPEEPLPAEEPLPKTVVAVDEKVPRPDPERLRAALDALQGPSATLRLGPFTVHTDLADREPLQALAPVAAALPRVYEERFGLPRAEGGEEVVVLLGGEASYRRLQGTELSRNDPEILGHAGGGMAVLVAANRSSDQLRALLVHELIHLLNRRAFVRPPRPWLEEGLADEPALGRWDRQGHPLPGTFWGESEIDREAVPVRGRRRLAAVSVEGSRGALRDLAGRARRGGLIPLDELLDLDAEAFLASSPDRSLRYAQSAFFVRFLLEGDGGRRAEALRSFLAAAAAGGPSDARALAAALGEEPRSLEAPFRSWLRFTEAVHSPRGAGMD